MTQVVDPESGLAFVELSHPWGMYTPIFPGYEEIKFERITYHAKHGVMTHKIVTIFHTSTHVNAPIHLIPQAPAVGDLALDGQLVIIVLHPFLSLFEGAIELAHPLAAHIVIVRPGHWRWGRSTGGKGRYLVTGAGCMAARRTGK